MERAGPNVHHIRCSEVWGGARYIDLDVRTSGVHASVFSGACDEERGGDIYYFSVCDSDQLTRVAVADVAGHGRAVSELAEWMYDAVAARMNTLDGAGLLAELNRLACERGLEAMTTAIVLGVYRADSRAYFTYAGHPPALVRRRGDRDWWKAMFPTARHGANLPLGVTPDASYEQHHIPVQAGDRVFLYTDGAVEARGPDGQFGPDRLMAVLREVADETPARQKAAVLSALRRHSGGRLNDDDITLLVIEVR